MGLKILDRHKNMFLHQGHLDLLYHIEIGRAHV